MTTPLLLLGHTLVLRLQLPSEQIAELHLDYTPDTLNITANGELIDTIPIIDLFPPDTLADAAAHAADILANPSSYPPSAAAAAAARLRTALQAADNEYDPSNGEPNHPRNPTNAEYDDSYTSEDDALVTADPDRRGYGEF